jgi:CBS domain-containing protein
VNEIRDIMKTNLITAQETMPVLEAVDLLVENNITGLPVLNEAGELVGLLTEKDVLDLVGSNWNRSAQVRDFMTREVVSFDIHDDLIAVCECLVNRPFRRVPITQGGKVVGIISRRDLIRYILAPL